MQFSFKSSLSGMRIVRTDSELECPEIDQAFRLAGAHLVLLPGGISENELINATHKADLLLMCYTPITAAVINRSTCLRGIVKYGVGIDAIDIDAAIAKGIPTVNVPEYAEQTVAEGAFCLMLSLLKRLVPMHQAMHEKGWINPEHNWLSQDVHGLSIALVGMGRIGCAFARMAGAGFGARVIAYDPAVSAQQMKASGVEKFDDIHTMLAQADVVSLHCVLNQSTHGTIGEYEFKCMQRQPVFINVSRGALVDEQALVAALNAGQVSAAGLDVYCSEPLNRRSHPLATLFDRDNVILLPHMTFFTAQAMQRLTQDTLERCDELLAGEAVTIRSSDPRLLEQRDRLNVRIEHHSKNQKHMN